VIISPVFQSRQTQRNCRNQGKSPQALNQLISVLGLIRGRFGFRSFIRSTSQGQLTPIKTHTQEGVKRQRSRREFMLWVNKHLDKAQVLAPPKLVAEYRQAAQALLDRYQS
jgi:hypothetical protein